LPAGLSHSKKLNNEDKGAWPFWPRETKKESFSCKLKKNQTTRKTLYELFYLKAAASGHGKDPRP
jgi:hypothetical protein